MGLIAAATTTVTTPMTPMTSPPPPLPDSSTSSASFFAVPKCRKKKYTLKLSALGALTKIEAFLPKSNSDHQTGGRQGLNSRALCAATPIYRLPLRMTTTFLPFLGRTYEYFSRRYTLHHHEFLCTVW